MRTKSFRDMHDQIYGLAAPGAPQRVDQRVSGNADVYEEAAEKTANSSKKGGRANARNHLAAKGVSLHGESPAIRQDKASRRASGGRNKPKGEKGLGGIGHLLIIGLPHLGAIPPNKDAHHELHHAKHRHEVKHSPHASSGGSYANGGCVSHGESLADVRRRTARD
jgi:hypothetical protein